MCCRHHLIRPQLGRMGQCARDVAVDAEHDAAECMVVDEDAAGFWHVDDAVGQFAREVAEEVGLGRRGRR